MNELFVPYQQSLDLKELGFDEPCFGYYLDDIDWLAYIDKIKKQPSNNKACLAPIFSQAFRWFRDKYKYCSYVKEATKDKYRFNFDKFDNGGYTSEIYNSYPEAELECLIKLIELVKSGSLKA